MKIRGGGFEVILDSISMATSPVRPKAVVWYRSAKFWMPHCRILSGVSELRYVLISPTFAIEIGRSGRAGDEPNDIVINETVDKER